MPSPSQSDLHINAPLTNVSIAYLQNSSAYIADKVFPRVPVAKQSDLYIKYSKSDWRRTDAQKRAHEAVDRIDWPEGFCRRDIGWRALKAQQEEAA